MPTKWLQERAKGSKNEHGMPPHRVFCGVWHVPAPLAWWQLELLTPTTSACDAHVTLFAAHLLRPTCRTARRLLPLCLLAPSSRLTGAADWSCWIRSGNGGYASCNLEEGSHQVHYGTLRGRRSGRAWGEHAQSRLGRSWVSIRERKRLNIMYRKENSSARPAQHFSSSPVW